MDKDQILKCLKDITKDSNPRYLHLVTVAINFVESRLKEKTDKKNYILTMLCASLVNLWITLEDCSNSPTGSFSGNGYRISKNSKIQVSAAKNLFEHWRALASNLLLDEGFAFFSVKGTC